MKKIFLIIVFLSFKANSQDLTGTWNIFSYEDEIVYYNKTTDSISYKKPARKIEADNFRKNAEFLIFPIIYKFIDDHYMINHITMGKISEGKFQIDKPRERIIMIDEEGKKEELTFTYTGKLLFIEMKMETGFLKIGLKRSID
jgi:hypothetical protein